MKKILGIAAVLGLMGALTFIAVKFGKNVFVADVKIEMVLIPAGKFKMGTTEYPNCMYDRKHEVNLTKPFYMGKYEVTQELWKSIMGDNPVEFFYHRREVLKKIRQNSNLAKNVFTAQENLDIRKAKLDFEKTKLLLLAKKNATTAQEKLDILEKLDEITAELEMYKPLPDIGKNFPVTGVSWDDCQKFIKKLNEKTKCGYRLPTEAEWEYACRAGTTTEYSFGNMVFSIDANFEKSKIFKPVVVGSYKANAFGLYDMHGNVLEWCEDWYGKYPIDDSVTDPKGPAMGEQRVLRGGYYGDCAESYSRGGLSTDINYSNIGFRLVRNP
jgi:formylglycine-generating enzyme required for sulfatase activity